MCGICGELSFAGQRRCLSRSLGADVRPRIAHRGPDHGAAYLSAGRRPPASASGASASSTCAPRPISRSATKTRPIQLVFNGEIYNFQELRPRPGRPRPPVPLERRFRSHRPPLRGAGRAGHRRTRRHVRAWRCGTTAPDGCCWRAIAPARSRCSSGTTTHASSLRRR